MSITPLPNHYAFENHPSVYDEESLTALEMCGRLGKKVNEVIAQVNGWNVPMISEVSPTGDKSGELDRAVIQGKLDAGYAVQLAAGDYYLNGPLRFQKGYALRGESQTETVIHCEATFLDHDPAVSVDHITVRDVTVRGPGSGIGFDISRKVSGIETGARYANFSNVSIAEYDTCVLLGGCWCTNFTHCRFDGLKTCVEQKGGCNNVKYDHCMFLGPMDQKSTIGLKISAEGGSENYGIRLDHCDFERHDKAVQAYYCVALNVTSVYVEGVNTVFSLDSCPSFLCDGGYISYPERVCNTSRTNAANVFSKCRGAIMNLYVRVNNNERFYLVSTSSTAPLKVENITCINDGVGECFVNAQHVSGYWGGHEYANKFTPWLDCNLKGGFSLFNFANHLYMPRVDGTQYKLQEVKILLTDALTPTASAAIYLTVPGDTIGRGSSERVKIMVAYINAGETYAKNTEIKFSLISQDYRDVILNSVSGLQVSLSANFTTDAPAKFMLSMANENMIL